jgi:pyruvate formate lyase activating enzyme
MPSGLEPRGVVFNVMRFAVHDGPGIRTTVFFKGCPLECRWCHNPESHQHRPEPMYFEERCRHCGTCARICPHGAVSVSNGEVRTNRERCERCGTCLDACAADAREICGRSVGVNELVSEIERDVVFFDDSNGGVTLSGGEPLAQPRFAAALLRACRERGISTVVETCGFAHPDVFRAVTELAGLVLFDLKMLNRQEHRHYTGVFNDSILLNLESAAAGGRPPVVRIPVIPGINDSDDHSHKFAAYLAGLKIPRVDLLPYHRIGSDKYRRLDRPCPMDDVAAPGGDMLEHFARPMRDAGIEVTIGG